MFWSGGGSDGEGGGQAFWVGWVEGFPSQLWGWWGLDPLETGGSEDWTLFLEQVNGWCHLSHWQCWPDFVVCAKGELLGDTALSVLVGQ